jgi:hypothetical protein
VDGAGFMPETREAFSSQGDGTLTVIKGNGPKSFEVEQNVKTMPSAKTMTIDTKTTPQPCVSVRSLQQCIDLKPDEESYKRTSLALVRNYQNALDQPRVLRRFQRTIAEERPNRSQA